MPPDSTATKARLLGAALTEFAEHGIAGARVDRIAEQAGANKRLIYVYYGNKEQLFETVVGQALARARTKISRSTGSSALLRWPACWAWAIALSLDR
jgi:AcrR family transcriptional regulator